MSMIEIRHPKIDEKRLWLPLWKDYLAWYGSEIDSNITDLTWNRFHDNHELVYMYGAYNNSNIVGFVTFIRHRSTWAENHYCYLEDLFIDEKARNKGIGTKLINAVKKFAEDNNCQRLYWQSLAKNTKARELYKRLATEEDFVQYRISI